MTQEEQGTMPRAMALSRRLGISVSSEEAQALHDNILDMVQAGVAEGMQYAREQCARVALGHSHRDDDMGAIIARAIRAWGPK